MGYCIYIGRQSSHPKPRKDTMATVMDENGIRTVTKGDIIHTYIAATNDGYGWASEPTEAAAIEAGTRPSERQTPPTRGLAPSSWSASRAPPQL